MPGEGSASRRSSLEQGLPPILVGEIPLHRAPQALLHVHLRRPVQLRLDLAGINRVAPVVARPMPRRWMRFFIAELQSRSEAHQLLAKLIKEECHRALKALSQRDVCPPTQGGQPAHIQLFLRRAIRFAGIPMDLALEAGGLSHRLRLRLRQIIHMQELPQGGAGASAGNAGVAALNRFVEAADQGRTQLQAGDLGYRVPLIRGLQRAGEQRFLPDRLLGELRVDAAAAQKQQAPHTTAPSRLDHVGLDLEVVEQEISWIGAVGGDAAHSGRRQHHHRGLVFGKPALHGRWRCLLCHGGRPRRSGQVFRGDQAIHQLMPPTWSTGGLSWFPMDPHPMAERVVNVHEAKTHFSRLIDAAHAGETILVAKGGKPWARLVPLEQPRPRRQAGVLAGSITLPAPELLLEPLPEEELAALEQPLL